MTYSPTKLNLKKKKWHIINLKKTNMREQGCVGLMTGEEDILAIFRKTGRQKKKYLTQKLHMMKKSTSVPGYFLIGIENISHRVL